MTLNLDSQPRTGFLRSVLSRGWLTLALILGVYAFLLLPTLGRQGISWDEQNDLWIAQAYLKPGGWLAGSDIDPSQARLPMATTALVYAFTGASDLLTGRWVSALVGGLALAGVFVFAQQRYSPRHAILVAGLLATSPLYLAFGRVAFTETDIFLAGAVAWLLVALHRLQEKPSVGRALVAGVLFGLAVATKFTALALLPGIVAAMWGLERPQNEGNAPAGHTWFWAGWSLAVLLAALDFAHRCPAESYTPAVQAAHYAFSLLGWLLPLGWALRCRRQRSDPRALAGLVVGLGLLTALLVPPEHLTNPEILGSIFWRAENEMAFSPAFMVEAAGLHLAVIFFKSTPLIGLGLLASWLCALSRWRDSAWQFPVFLATGYFAGLLILPIAQTFYTIPLLPILAVFGADIFLRLWQQRRKWALVVGAVTIFAWGAEMTQCYPDYNLNGYPWLGLRKIFGRASVGYRSVVQTPSDGVQQALEWVNVHAVPGEIVQVYALEWHIVEATAGNPVYRLQSGFENTLFSKPDYVVVHINTLIRQSWYMDASQGDLLRYPYDPVKLGQEYEKVFGVERAFGLEMASVWHRK
jgi:hypothetical protein